MIDTHAHVMFKQFDEDRSEILPRANEAGVAGWIEVGTDLEQSRKAIELAEKYEHVWATVGVHPTDVRKLHSSVWNEIEAMLDHKKVVAIGEVGYDLYRGGNLKEQCLVLKQFMELAVKKDKPVIYHMRSGDKVDVNQELIDYLKHVSEEARPRGVMHTFSGSMKQANEFLDLGMYLGFSGIVTFKNAGPVVDIVKEVPLDRILVETDCPYLAPEPYRGQRNEPAYVRQVAEKIAELKGVELEEVDRVTTENARQLFVLK